MALYGTTLEKAKSASREGGSVPELEPPIQEQGQPNNVCVFGDQDDFCLREIRSSSLVLSFLKHHLF